MFENNFMKLKRMYPFLTILFQLLFFSVFSETITFQENPLTKAIQLFDKEKYIEAEPLFKELLNEKPDDFMVNYFYGACRTENGHYSEKDLSYLIKASKEVNPLNIDYYFAVQYHAKNQWERAMAYYNLYKTISSVNEQEKVGLALKMEQCQNQINPFVETEETESDEESVSSEAAAVAVATDVTTETVVDEHSQIIPVVSDVDSTNYEISESEMDDVLVFGSDSTILDTDTLVSEIESEEEFNETIAKMPEEEQITFYVNKEITYLVPSNFRTEEGRAYFDEGQETQMKLDLVIADTEKLREDYNQSKSRIERDSIGIKILEFEDRTYDLNNVVKQLFLLAKNAENDYWEKASLEEKESFLQELDSIAKMEEELVDYEEILFPESPELIIPPILSDEQSSAVTLEDNNSGISYKIQLGAYSRGIPTSMQPVFKKISILRKVENYTDENGVVVYTTGNLTSYEDAVVMQKQVKQEGIKDCKIAAYLNGKRITLEQAKELDKNR
jgi:hypothetical protein